jgi:hypothetical protein
MIKIMKKYLFPFFILFLIQNPVSFVQGNSIKMKNLNPKYEYKVDYPGNHKWFWKVREQYWDDIISFLDKNLK